jgi:acetyl-CoA carboxylase biotin carboxylase subunit
MFSKVLIANRGEIAVRIIAACRELGVQTVAVHSEADRECLHVQLADQAVCIGPSDSASSYLNTTSVMSAAQITGADAIHPGYGFLAENAHFAEIVDACGLTFIGPSPEAIRLMGNKSQARTTMAASEVPVLPGSDGPVQSAAEALKLAREIGFPVILKASAGGGGRGMRLAWDPEDLQNAYDTARNEADRAFGDATLYLEKYLQRPRHIEFQILADSHGRVIHLGERECSIQRRHQKIIEEAPSVALDPDLRAEMGRAAVAAARAAKYENAGTVEFLLDEDGSFYFMEMNTRIQVEHPVTELVTGVDLVIEQLRIAAGKPISVAKRKQVRPKGHAIEFRINAEDPETFAPSPGRITHFSIPSGPGVRLDTHVYGGYMVPPYYDSLVAKLLVYGKDRQEAIARGRRALSMLKIEGIKTSVSLHERILESDDFKAGRLDTHFMERFLAD